VNQIEATRATAARAENRNPAAQEAASIV